MTEPDTIGIGGGGGTSVLDRPITGSPEPYTDLGHWSDEEVDELLKTIAEADEAKCEFRHIHTACSHKVVARVMDCAVSGLTCQSAVNSVINKMEDGSPCRRCMRPAAECWKIIKA